MENTLYGVINLICVILLLMEIINCIHSPNKTPHWRYFLRALIAMDIAFIFDMFYGFLDGDHLGACFLANLLDSGFNYGLVVGAYFWFIYSEARQDAKYILERKNRLLLAVPIAVVIVLGLCGLLFYHDENGYHRGSLYIIEIIVMYGMIIFTGIKAFYKSFLRTNYPKRFEYRSLTSFMILPLFFEVFQFILQGAVPMLCIGITLALVAVYQTHLQSLISKDPLTGLNNRNDFVNYLSRRMFSNSKPLYLMLIDMDKFKLINDTYGHTEGDKALLCVVDVLKRVVPRHFLVARYGGDEFVIVGETDDDSVILQIRNDINAMLHEINGSGEYPWKLSVSVGIAMRTPKMTTIPDFIDAADAEMYKQKHRITA